MGRAAGGVARSCDGECGHGTRREPNSRPVGTSDRLLITARRTNARRQAHVLLGAFEARCHPLVGRSPS